MPPTTPGASTLSSILSLRILAALKSRKFNIDAPMKDRTLDGIRVVELGEMVSAPYCARLMASLGAEVIKIEPPGGERARASGPFPNGDLHPEKSGLFLAMNLGKKGVTLDMTSREGARLFRKLAGESDVVVENGPPGRMEKLGLSYESLRAGNPGLIMASITPFGQDGPHKDYIAHDLNRWHAGGWGYLWKERSAYGVPGRMVRGTEFLSGFQAAYNALTATLGALYFRDLGGEGQHVDVSEQEAMAFILDGAFPVYNGVNRIHGKDVAIPASVPSGVLPCRDGYVLISAIEHHQWEGLVKMLGEPDWSREEWAGTVEGRRLNFDIINAFMMEWLEDKSVDWVVKESIEHRIPASPVGVTAERIFKDEHLKERGFFVEIDHPVVGKLTYPSAPFRFSETECSTREGAPLLGQHNAEVLGEGLGLSGSDLARLKWEGII